MAGKKISKPKLRVWMVGYKCQLSVKILAICQLSVTLIHTLFKTLARIVVDLRAGLHLFFFLINIYPGGSNLAELVLMEP